jgi:hypothetical protein
MAKMYKVNWPAQREFIKKWMSDIDDPNAKISEAGMTTRTLTQNKSLHLWLSRLADELNASGQSLGDGIVIQVPVAFTGDNLKENCLKPLMTALHPDKKSTTELTTVEIQDLYMRLDQIISSRSGCHVEWPSEESMSEEQR